MLDFLAFSLFSYIMFSLIIFIVILLLGRSLYVAFLFSFLWVPLILYYMFSVILDIIDDLKEKDDNESS